jgi:hypothetical protein
MNYKCKHCNKEYASASSRCNHIKKFHKPPVVKESEKNSKKDEKNHEKSENVVINVASVENNNSLSNECKFCKKKLCDRFYRWKHEKKCSVKEDKNNKVDTEPPISRTDVVNIFKEMLSSMKIHPKTLEKINNQLINSNNSNSNNTVINNNNIIIPLSEQNLKEVLNKSDKMAILNSGSQAHLKLTDMIYNNPELKKYRNIYVTNLSNNIAYVYDNEKKCFIVKNKKDILEDYGVERFSDIQYFYEELKNKVNDKQLTKLKKMVNDYFNDNDFKDLKNKELLIELYNNRVQVQQIYETVNKNIKEIEL